MNTPKKDLGRPLSSSSGRLPKVRYCASTPVITTGMGGQPGMLTMGLSLTRSDTETAPVGIGLAFGLPPKDAQEPPAMTAAAPAAASFRMSTLERPPMQE